MKEKLQLIAYIAIIFIALSITIFGAVQATNLYRNLIQQDQLNQTNIQGVINFLNSVQPK